MDFDLSQYEAADTAPLTLKNLKGDDDLKGTDGKPVTVEVYSPGSPEGVRALHKSSRQSQMRMFRSMRGDFDPNDAVNAEREQAEKLAGFTKSISDNFPVTPLAVYQNPKLGYISKQVEEFAGKWGNFSKGSSAA